jgi:acyl-coenzyme A synthetase/AMP-(fatty) acid ligase
MSARNVFIAPWLRGAPALLHDARFDPDERLELLERERVGVLCMAPTEHRVIAKRTELKPLPSLRALVAAGEALNPEILHTWHDVTGVWIRDGYGQTETGQITARSRSQRHAGRGAARSCSGACGRRVARPGEGAARARRPRRAGLGRTPWARAPARVSCSSSRRLAQT